MIVYQREPAEQVNWAIYTQLTLIDLVTSSLKRIELSLNGVI